MWWSYPTWFLFRPWWFLFRHNLTAFRFGILDKPTKVQLKHNYSHYCGAVYMEICSCRNDLNTICIRYEVRGTQWVIGTGAGKLGHTYDSVAVQQAYLIYILCNIALKKMPGITHVISPIKVFRIKRPRLYYSIKFEDESLWGKLDTISPCIFIMRTRNIFLI